MTAVNFFHGYNFKPGTLHSELQSLDLGILLGVLPNWFTIQTWSLKLQTFPHWLGRRFREAFCGQRDQLARKFSRRRNGRFNGIIWRVGRLFQRPRLVIRGGQVIRTSKLRGVFHRVHEMDEIWLWWVGFKICRTLPTSETNANSLHRSSAAKEKANISHRLNLSESKSEKALLQTAQTGQLINFEIGY